MSEKVERLYQELTKNTPLDLRPFILSLALTREGADEERSHGPNLDKIWTVNTELLNKVLNGEDKKDVLGKAVFLATLPKSYNEEIEWYYRWLRGNGLYMLQDPRLKGAFNEFLDNEKESKPLKEALLNFLSADIKGLDKKDLSDVPEGYSLFVSFLVCDNLINDPLEMAGARRELLNKAAKRLENLEVNRVMQYFGEIADTKPLYSRLISFKNWLSSGEYWS